MREAAQQLELAAGGAQQRVWFGRCALAVGAARKICSHVSGLGQAAFEAVSGFCYRTEDPCL